MSLFGTDKVQRSCVLQAPSHCSLWVAGSSPLGNCPHTNRFHSPPESLSLSVCYRHHLGVLLQAPALLFVQTSAGSEHRGRPCHAPKRCVGRKGTAGMPARSENPPQAAGGPAVGDCCADCCSGMLQEPW